MTSEKKTDTQAALLIIGAEVLAAKVEDLNTPYLLRNLRAQGVDVIEVRVIGDDIDEIAKAVRELKAKVDFVFTTGGIGPTHDDVTMAGVAKAFDRNIIRHPEIVAAFEQALGDRLRPATLNMADIPEGAEIVWSESSLTPVVCVENVTIFPGIPKLMQVCFQSVKERFCGEDFFSDMIRLNASESQIAPILENVQQKHTDTSIGSYPQEKGSDCRVLVTVDSRSKLLNEEVLNALKEGLNPEWIIDSLDG